MEKVFASWRLYVKRFGQSWLSERVIFYALTFALLAACAPVNAVEPTPVVAGLTGSGPDQAEALIPTLEPFRFDLPQPGAAPVSGWRPPLYPVPWSMSSYDHFYFVRPIAADQVNWPLADYRYGGIYFAPNIIHTGVDIPSPQGVPIHAAGPGTIVWSGWGLYTEAPDNKEDPYGLAVAIRHDFGYKGQQLYTAYAHMSEVFAILGQHVETGDLLGLVGSTGATTGPHLHFEVRLPGNSFHNTYNPELWTAPPQGWGVLVGRVMDAKGETLQQLEVSVRNEETRETRIVKTYGGGPINHDPVYNENLVLGDLPAGLYKITLRYDEFRNMQTWLNIYPGHVTYFTFKGENGFTIAPPPMPTLDFLPAPASATPPPTP
jgi:murein DD-endopeptidase MepM/ murein hydrolase activator NlpD